MQSGKKLGKSIIPLLLFLMASQGMMGGALVSPGLSVLAEAFQISESSIGIVLSLLTIAAAISLPLTGLLTDIMGRRINGNNISDYQWCFRDSLCLCREFWTTTLFQIHAGNRYCRFDPFSDYYCK